MTEVAGTRIKNGGHRNSSSGYTVGTEGLRKNWMGIIRWDLKDMDTTWDEAKL